MGGGREQDGVKGARFGIEKGRQKPVDGWW